MNTLVYAPFVVVNFFRPICIGSLNYRYFCELGRYITHIRLPPRLLVFVPFFNFQCFPMTIHMYPVHFLVLLWARKLLALANKNWLNLHIGNPEHASSHWHFGSNPSCSHYQCSMLPAKINFELSYMHASYKLAYCVYNR